MQIQPIHTPVITPNNPLTSVLAAAMQSLSDSSIVVVTSKLVSLAEGSYVLAANTDEQAVVTRDADWYTYAKPDKSFALTITHNTLIPNAGVDPAGDWLVSLPNNPQNSANILRAWLRETYDIKNVGVIITDTTTRPLQRGTTGIALAHSGFAALHDYRGESDVFGRTLEPTWANHAQALAAAAVVTMGEANEQTPLAVITDIPFVQFQDRDPSPEELTQLQVTKGRDVYAPLLNSVNWQRGSSKGSK